MANVAGTDDPQIENIAPNDPVGINMHAITGDGSSREADFTEVNLGDLGGSLQTFASQDGTSLNEAIAEAAATGKVQEISISDISAGGGQSGKTGLDQIGGIGRFAVDVTGLVMSDGKTWTMAASVTGVPDVQDYPHDSRRGSIAGPVNDAFGRLQSMKGGHNFIIRFFGSQSIRISGAVR